jgi:hypothetical protein
VRKGHGFDFSNSLHDVVSTPKQIIPVLEGMLQIVTINKIIAKKTSSLKRGQGSKNTRLATQVI